MYGSTEDWSKNWLALSKNVVYRLKNSDFILESKMVELSRKENLLIQFENCQDVPYSHK